MMQTNKLYIYQNHIEVRRRQRHPQNHLQTTKKVWGMNELVEKQKQRT